jgi:ribosomal-protein-alanine acetyltransferase
MSRTLPLVATIRPLVTADVPAVAAIEASVQAFPWTVAQFAESLAQGHSGWGVIDGDQVIAFAVTSQVLDELSLLTIGVAPEQQRRGLATALLDHIVERAAETGAAVMILEVRKGNAAARALYRRYGFVEVGQRRGYYRAADGREDAILMALTLDEGGR